MQGFKAEGDASGAGMGRSSASASATRSAGSADVLLAGGEAAGHHDEARCAEIVRRIEPPAVLVDGRCTGEGIGQIDPRRRAQAGDEQPGVADQPPAAAGAMPSRYWFQTPMPRAPWRA